MRFCNVVWTTMVVGLLGSALLLSGCGQKVAAPLPFTITQTSSEEVITKVTLFGKVRDQDGNPVQGASVTLGTERVTSGADGSYAFAGLPPGSYYVSVYSEGYIATGAGFFVSTTDVIDADLTLTKLDLLPNVEEVRGTEIVDVTEEGVTVGVKTIFSGEPPLGVPPEEVELAVTLVLGSGVQIKDAAGNVLTEAPTIAVTFLDQTQCPTPASGTFGMKPEDVYTRAGTKETATQTVVIEGETVELTVETPNELLTEGTQVQASNVPFAGIVLEANGEQGGTFSEPQKVTVRPEQMTVPVDFLGAGIPAGVQIPFVDSDGEVIYGTLQEDGTIDLEVTKIDTYLMQTNVEINVEDSEVSLQTGAAKPVAPQAQITASQAEFEFQDPLETAIDPAFVEWIKAQLIQRLNLLDEGRTTMIDLGLDESVIETTTSCVITIVVSFQTEGEEYEIGSYRVEITVAEGRIVKVEIIEVVHESGTVT